MESSKKNEAQREEFRKLIAELQRRADLKYGHIDKVAIIQVLLKMFSGILISVSLN